MGDPLVLYVVRLKVILTRTPGTGRARIDERIQDSVDGAKAHCKAARGLGAVGVSVEAAAALGTFSAATVSSMETASATSSTTGQPDKEKPKRRNRLRHRRT